jgi:3-isopropylmalate dehydratase small subunit
MDGGFALDRFAGRPILVAGRNFGCGSSREQAVWALDDFGIRCVIAPSFGDIFYANALRGGLLPIGAPDAALPDLIQAAERGVPFEIDVADATLRVGAGRWPIALSDDERRALIAGWDETEVILADHAGQIAAYEAKARAAQPWMFRPRTGT